jgi:hypothetical protein
VVAGLTLSRASPLPQGFVPFSTFVNNTKSCGSGLAREEARPDNTKSWFLTKIPVIKKPLDRGALGEALTANPHQVI